MHQADFERTYSQDWECLARMLDDLPNQHQLSEQCRAELETLPELYRRVCCQYSLALKRRYTTGLADELHALVLRGHRLIYQHRGQSLSRALGFLTTTFPRETRKAWRYLLASTLFFLVPALILGVSSYRDPTMIYSVMPPFQVERMEKMYNPRPGEKIRYGPQSDIAMFGYYIHNNVSIDFRTFAGGIFFGAGSLLVLAYNGVLMGGVAGHLSHPPFADNFWPFVIGHSPLELTGMVLSGAAGLMLGLALIRPAGRYRRLDELKLVAPHALALLMGGATMTVLAAVIEAFWSAQVLPFGLKLAFSLVNWAAVLGYLVFAGRRFGKNAA